MTQSKILKRHAAPRSWPILRKKNPYVPNPLPGPHPQRNSLPLSLVLKSIGACVTSREASYLIQNQEVHVDGRRINETRFPVGLFDILHIPKLKKSYHITINNKGKLIVKEIDAKANTKVCRIVGKKMVKGGKLQLNLNDSRNILVEKDEYKVGDSILVEVPSQKISKHLPLKKGAKVLLTAGRHKGNEVQVDELQEDGTIIFKVGDVASKTHKKNTYVIQ